MDLNFRSIGCLMRVFVLAQKRGSREKALRRQQRSFRVNIEDIEDSVCSVEGVSTYSEAGR